MKQKAQRENGVRIDTTMELCSCTEMKTDRERQSEEGKRTTPIRPRHEEAAITSALVIERKWLKVLLGSRKSLLSSTTTHHHHHHHYQQQPAVPSLPCLPLPSAIVSSFSFRIFSSFFFFIFLFGFFL
ncbi:hypothetical protein ALC56_08521 [Trachymyrmex septentrionalis]|uniref:Transmembrane protein n=1 Tax=Trachymyrmex septentrionalis TaxID=34720 RepID=A0A195F7Y9_9HYME|nr:hypothetical protein ALC56_08521 [Trachymyrmex septentrionalis]